MIKVFAKDIGELAAPPFLGIWILLVPLLLLYVIGHGDTELTPVRTLIENAQTAKPSSTTVHRLVSEFSDVMILPDEWDGTGGAATMERHRAELAVRWTNPLHEKESWRILVRPVRPNRQTELVALAQQVALSIPLGKPWQVEALEGAVGWPKRRESKQFLGPWGTLGTNVGILGGLASDPNKKSIAILMSIAITFLPFLLACSLMAREWEHETLSTLLVAPGIGWWSVVSGKVLVALFATTICFLSLLIVAVAFFDIAPRMSMAPVFGAQVIAMTTSAFLGIAASSLTRSSFQAYFLSALYVICLIFLTGIAFPVAAGSSIVLGVTKALPLTFSFSPLYQWLLHGSSDWLQDASLYWLAGQSGISLAIMVASVAAARRQI